MTQFSPEHYARLISELRAQGYVSCDYATADAARRHLILRHDVDMSLALAAEMAVLEASLGLASTYFVLVRSEFYNPFTPESAAYLAAIRANGHAIGLHFDAAICSQDSAEMEVAAARECDMLEAAIGAPVETVSFHRPAPGLIGRAPAFAGRISVYGARYVIDIGYCSDSRGGWHHGHPLEQPAVRDGRALQLLTHPIWWMGAPATPSERLQRFLAERASFLDLKLAEHCMVHQPNRGL